jgi:hypothetical protein
MKEEEEENLRLFEELQLKKKEEEAELARALQEQQEELLKIEAEKKL